MLLKACLLLMGSLSGVLTSTTIPASVVPPAPNPTVSIMPPPPDLMNYAAPPYPALPSDWNANVTTQNLLGTRLYGWLGCGPPEINQITGAYDEFSTLVRQAGVMTGIDWTDQAAKDFWGPSLGKNALTDTAHSQIQFVFNLLSDVYPGNLPFISHWIKVRCSSSVEKLGDPDDVCGDRKSRKTCADGSTPSPNPDDTQTEAYSDNLYAEGQYDRITFCGKFLTAQTLDIAVKQGVSKRDKNLHNYDNRARIFLHEMTHLDYFINAPTSTPSTTDIKLSLKYNGKAEADLAYGALRTKILANWRPNRGGFYTQRNADSYAWYALSKYVWGKLGGAVTDYPVEPLTLGIKPLKKPVDKDGSTIKADGSDGDEFDPTFGVTDINFPFQGMTEATFDQTEQWFDIVSCPQFNPFPASSSKVKRRWSA